MTYGSQTKRRSDELEVNDMFNVAGVSYIVHRIDRSDPDWMEIDADQMIGRETWTITIRLPHDVPFQSQS